MSERSTSYRLWCVYDRTTGGWRWILSPLVKDLIPGHLTRDLASSEPVFATIDEARISGIAAFQRLSEPDWKLVYNDLNREERGDTE